MDFALMLFAAALLSVHDVPESHSTQAILWLAGMCLALAAILEHWV